MNSEDTPSKPNPTQKRLEDMPEPELSAHFNEIMDAVQERQPDDVLGSFVVSAMENGLVQYVSSLPLAAVVAILRELADRLERRETVERN